MVEKHPEENMFVEINYSRGMQREASGSKTVLPMHRQVLQSPAGTPVKYAYDDDDDVGQLPP
jgi:hypothetical protein